MFNETIETWFMMFLKFAYNAMEIFKAWGNRNIFFAVLRILSSSVVYNKTSMQVVLLKFCFEDFILDLSIDS